MKVTIAIPARLESTRLPEKLLMEVSGKPVLRHAWEATRTWTRADDVVVLTDSPRIRNEAVSWGASVVETASTFRNGTERIASVADGFDSDLVINVQGDQVGVTHDLLDQLLSTWGDHSEKVVTPIFRIDDLSDNANCDVVKVRINNSGEAVDFSRRPQAGRMESEEDGGDHPGWRHVGVYGYSPALLQAYSNLPPSENEMRERLEQLRFTHNGFSIQTFETHRKPISIDSMGDVVRTNQLADRISRRLLRNL